MQHGLPRPIRNRRLFAGPKAATCPGRKSRKHLATGTLSMTLRVTRAPTPGCSQNERLQSRSSEARAWPGLSHARLTLPDIRPSITIAAAGSPKPGVVMKTASVLSFLAVSFLLGSPAPSAAQDTLKVAVPQRGAWDTSITEIGHRAGIFRKHGVNVELLFTGGGAEALGAIIGGSIDMAVSVGFSTVLGSYSKGAPLRVFSAETTGQPDIYWFVPAQSPIKSVSDFKDKTVGYSVSGSSSHAALLALLAQEKIVAKPTSTGGVTPSFTSAMTGQVDVGWTTIPIGLKEIDQGTIRAVAWASDVVSMRNRTVRVNITNAVTMETRKPVLDRYLTAYRETIDYMYSSPDALVVFADIANVPLSVAQQIPERVPKAALSPDQIVGMDDVMAEAVATKFMSTPLTKAQIAELVRMPVAPK